MGLRVSGSKGSAKDLRLIGFKALGLKGSRFGR